VQSEQDGGGAVPPPPFRCCHWDKTTADAATAAAIGAGGALAGPLRGRAGVWCWAESRAIRCGP
jgi:hypothetical protein